MARNVVQFQKGLSEPEFERRYGREEQWRAVVIASRWPDADRQLSGRVEIDDAYLGGERSGGRDRGAAGKTPFVAAVDTIKLRRVSSFSSAAVSVFAKRCLAASCAVVSDGLQCFAAVTKAGGSHQAIKTGGGAATARKPAFNWVNTALGNIKASIVATYRSTTASMFRATSPGFDRLLQTVAR